MPSFLCGNIINWKGWSTAREASQPSVQTPVPETAPFLVPKTLISKEVKCCFLHLSTYRRAQVRQGARSTTTTECRNVQLDSCICLSCWQPAAEPARPGHVWCTNTGMCQHPRFEQRRPGRTKLYRGKSSSMVPASQTPSPCLRS